MQKESLSLALRSFHDLFMIFSILLTSQSLKEEEVSCAKEHGEAREVVDRQYGAFGVVMVLTGSSSSRT